MGGSTEGLVEGRQAEWQSCFGFLDFHGLEVLATCSSGVPDNSRLEVLSEGVEGAMTSSLGSRFKAGSKETRLLLVRASVADQTTLQ